MGQIRAPIKGDIKPLTDEGAYDIHMASFMCRLLGMIGKPSNLPVQTALQAFYPLCTGGHVKKGMAPGHLDGWGLSGFSRDRAVYFERRPEAANADKAAFDQAVQRAVKNQPPIVVAHFRKASVGENTVSNTQPYHYRDWIGAHNGTIFGALASIALNEARPQGATDSERFLLWLIEDLNASRDPTEDLVALLKQSREKLVHTSLNFLLSNGQRLWAYREFGDKRLDKGETVADRDAYYTLYWSALEGGAVICSEPLSAVARNWTPLAQRTLAVFTRDSSKPQLFKI